ncbi:hypothetical protein, partial [Methyloglobulus sp.]|uniref:hypothetical protein n=1 Tax=Methyloglobulus sp. TaxID=2518622 RepID=UPI0032B7CF10
PASIPLCVAKCFKSKSFYQKFKFFWLFSAFIFTSLTTALTGIMIPSADSAIINFELVLFVICPSRTGHVAPFVGFQRGTKPHPSAKDQQRHRRQNVSNGVTYPVTRSSCKGLKI